MHSPNTLSDVAKAQLLDPDGDLSDALFEELLYAGYGGSPERAAIDQALTETREDDGVWLTEMSFLPETVIEHLLEHHDTHPVLAPAALVERVIYHELPEALGEGYSRADLLHLTGFWSYLAREFQRPEIAAARAVCAAALAAFDAGDPRLPRQADEDLEGESLG